MKKDFTREDILKKHETNIKSASTAILLSGVLGIIYIVRYALSGTFDSFFSLSFTEMLLRLGESRLSNALLIVISIAYALAYTSLALFSNKHTKLLYAGLVIYLFDFACLIYSLICVFPQPLDSAHFIDVFVHLFVVTFLVVGIVSQKKIKE